MIDIHTVSSQYSAVINEILMSARLNGRGGWHPSEGALVKGKQNYKN